MFLRCFMKACVFSSTSPLLCKGVACSWVLCQLVLGCLLLVICSKITIPLYPIPVTMQTVGIFLLSIMQGGKKAFCSVLLYLLLVFLGFPVLAIAGSHPFWWMLPQAGYLIAFPIAAFVVGMMLDIYSRFSLVVLVLSIVTGKCIIYCLGVLGLMRIMSFEQSMAVGFVPFLPMAVVKIVLLSYFGKLWLHRMKKQRGVLG